MAAMRRCPDGPMMPKCPNAPMQVCEVPQGEYKLGVGRIFLKHRAAQMLDALHYYDQVRVRVTARARVRAQTETNKLALRYIGPP